MMRYILFAAVCGLLFVSCAVAQDVLEPTPVEVTIPAPIPVPAPVITAPLPTSGWLIERRMIPFFGWKARPVMIQTAPVMVVRSVRPTVVWTPTIVWR